MTYDLPSPAQAAPGIHTAPHQDEDLEHAPLNNIRRLPAGCTLEEDRGAHEEPFHFAAHGRVVEVSSSPPLARSFCLRCGICCCKL